MARIFISYSRKDETFARQLATSLSDLGADVWIDVEDIPPGMNWSNAIDQGLKTCEVMLLIVSPASMASSNVEDEWQFFHGEKKTIIPLRLEAVDNLHFQLRRLQYIDFSKQPFEVGFKQLHKRLSDLSITLKPLPPAYNNVAAPPLPTPASSAPPDQAQQQRQINLFGRFGACQVTLTVATLVVVAAIGVGAVINQREQTAAQETRVAVASTSTFEAESNAATATSQAEFSALSTMTMVAQQAEDESATQTADAQFMQRATEAGLTQTAAVQGDEPTDAPSPTFTLTPTSPPAFTPTPTAVITAAPAFALAIERSGDTVAVCAGQAADLSALQLDFGRNERYTLVSLFPEVRQTGAGQCWCLQKRSPLFPVPSVCTGANTSVQSQAGDWRNAIITLSDGSKKIGECAAQPNNLNTYRCEFAQ